MSRKSDAALDRLKPELAGVGLFTAGVFVLASLILSAQDSPAYIPAAVAESLRFLVGSGAYLVAFALLGLGVAALTGSVDALNARILGAVGLFFLCFLLARHVGVPRGAEFDTAAIDHGGGVVGASLWWGAGRLLGPICTWIVLAGVLLVAAVLFTQGQVLASSAFLAKGASAGGRWLMERVRSQSAALGQKVAQRKAPRPEPPLVVGAAEEPPEEPVPQTIELSFEDEEPAEPEQAEELVAEAEETVLAEPADPPEEPPEPADEADDPLPTAPPPDEDEPTEEPVVATFAPPTPPSEAKQLPLMSNTELYERPPLGLISRLDADGEVGPDRAQAQASIELLEDTLRSFGIDAKVRHYVRGPAVTRYEVEPVRGIRVNRIARLADDLALAFAAIDVRVEAPIPGKSLIGIEVPNSEVAIVGLRSILQSDAYRNAKSPLAVGIGKDIAGAPVVADLTRMPHLLIAGATNSGKTICLHAIVTSLLMRARPDEVRLIMIDPKRVELNLYDGIPHLMAPVVQTAPHAADVLRKIIREMEHRYDMFAMKGVANIAEYNEFSAMEKEDDDEEFDPLPYVVVVIDELADLMMQAKAEFEFSICRIAQLARATGIHLVIATQRPSVNVITGTIKANIPSRIALAVASPHDSRTIIDIQGAERLIGRGDMLFRPFDASKGRRVQGAFISRGDLDRIVDHLRDQGEPDYDIIPEVQDEMAGYGDESEPSDELYAKAVDLVAANQEASVSMLQRRFKIGYARAGRLVDMMEERGVIGPSEGSKARKVLVPPGYKVRGPGLSMEEDRPFSVEPDAEAMSPYEDGSAVLVQNDGE